MRDGQTNPLVANPLEEFVVVAVVAVVNVATGCIIAFIGAS